MEYTELNCIANIVSGYAIPSCDMTNEGTAIIKITNIREDGTLDLVNTARYNKPITDKLKKFLLREKDIVVCMTGATIGKVARILKIDQDYIVNQRVAIIRAKNQELQDFVFQILTLPTFRKYVEIVGYGAAQPNISANAIGKYKFLNSGDIFIQRRIASILSAYDNLIENNNRRIRLLEQMAENLYKEWFVRFRFPGHEKVEMENGLPKGWRYAKLEEVLSLKDSTRIPLSSIERSNMQKIYPYYGAASILDYVSDYLFDGVYLLLGEDGSVIDENGYPYIQYVWGKFWVNNHAHVIEKKGVYSVEFMYCMFKKMNIQSIVTGVAQPKISQGRLFNKKVIIPCDSIISLFDKQIQPIFAEIRQLTNQITNLTRQRDLLLPRLMSGKIAVNA